MPLAQPAARLVRNLLDPHTSMDEASSPTQDERRKLRLPDQIYDVTAWSLSLLWDVELVTATQPTGANARAVHRRRARRCGDRLPAATVGYLMPWGSGTARGGRRGARRLG